MPSPLQWPRPRPGRPRLRLACIVAILPSLVAAQDSAPGTAMAGAEPLLRLDAASVRAPRASDSGDAPVRARHVLFREMNQLLPTRDTLRGLVADVDGALFVADGVAPGEGARERLARLGGLLAAHPRLRVRIEGHVGVDAASRRLAMARALAVRDRLVAHGVPAAHIVVVALGAARPVIGDGFTSARAPGRRVELVVSGADITPDEA